MNKRKLLLTISLIILIPSAVVLGKNIFSCKLPNDACGVRSVVERGSVDTLFIGSSGYRKGIDMDILRDGLGDAFMLTYNGNEPFNVLIELEEILSGGVSINRLVVDFNPSMIDRGADLSDKRLLWDVSFDAKRKLWKEIAKLESTELFTFYDYWVLSNNDYMLTYPISAPLIKSRYYFGGINPSEVTGCSNKAELDSMPIIENPGLNELQLNSTERIIEICKNEGIELIFLESPRYITLCENENYAAKSRELRSFIEERGAKCILGSDLEFDSKNPEFFSDTTHMSSVGKAEFTRKIVEALSQQPRRKRIHLSARYLFRYI